jgi:protein SCO1/2
MSINPLNRLAFALAAWLAASGVPAAEAEPEQHQHEAAAQAGADPHAHHKHGAPAQAVDDPHAHHDHGAPAQAGEDPHAHHKAMMAKPPEPAKAVEVVLRDLELVDQDGRPVRFVSDVIGDRIVVIDFIYTTCTTVCPVLSAVFSQIQSKLAERLGKEVVLVSVSVDPVRDTPARLKGYAETHKAGAGWTWLTGDKRVVDEVLKGLQAYTPNFEDHPPMVLVGDGRSGGWTRFFGFPGPDQIVARVDELAAVRAIQTR